MSSGYSNTPLIRKLGMKPGNSVLLINEPPGYLDLLGKLPDGVHFLDKNSEEDAEFIHLYAKNSVDLYKYFPIGKQRLKKDGMIWVSWIKKSSKMDTDISASDVRRLGLEIGLVDIKICAVDEDWSALKFVYRKKDR